MSSSSARNLDEAMASMRWVLEPGQFILVGLERLPDSGDYELLDPPAQIIVEQGETTLLVAARHEPEIIRRDPAARIERGLVWIRFEQTMGWEVVGFLARITTALANGGVPLGAVCGFSRDHLFINENYMAQARLILDGGV